MKIIKIWTSKKNEQPLCLVSILYYPIILGMMIDIISFIYSWAYISSNTSFCTCKFMFALVSSSVSSNTNVFVVSSWAWNLTLLGVGRHLVDGYHVVSHVWYLNVTRGVLFMVMHLASAAVFKWQSALLATKLSFLIWWY